MIDQPLADPGFVATALIHQLCYVADVAVHMQGDAHSLNWRTAKNTRLQRLPRYDSQPLTNSPLLSRTPVSTLPNI